MERKVKVAVVQFTPVHLDKAKTTEKLCGLIVEAGRNGVEIIVTGETGIPTYPYWRNRFTYSDLDTEITRAWRETAIQYYNESVRIPQDLKPLQEAAKMAGAYCIIGVSEQDDRPGSMTLFNTQVMIGKNGEYLGRHRKLIPTYEERLVWGRGDASDLKVWPTDVGTIGALVCYENHMTLAKAALCLMGEEIHVACWPGWTGNVTGKGLARHDDLSGSDIDSCLREYAFETQSFVLSASLYVPLESIPDSFPLKQHGNWTWATGGSAIVGPGGGYLVGPVMDKETILYATLDPADRLIAKRRFDAVGHYTRWDVVTLNLARRAQQPLHINSTNGHHGGEPNDNDLDRIPTSHDQGESVHRALQSGPQSAPQIDDHGD